ncbi:YtxH domain-containing protein [Cellulophaga sp. 20_2_10]|uniref:YtxH domain-containing protein n=1 Tax=Cellulophaga sp. 20_2_10 TaxID=2942476 RepID=UPI00201A9281|nr:YtxH domain-containing protein [Cellulophaga sp. 20_2_10]MCL5245144.1 YtxH domain-containing protein [Cellulophaga sp. 20_2_10]
MSNNSNTVLGVLAGTAIGAALGILFAPDKGVNTRKKLVDEAVATKESIADTALDIRNTVASTVVANKETLDSKLESLVSDASYKADDVIGQLEIKLKELKAKNKKLQKS